ncbi:MAG: Ig-like domain-containing protein, partial [Planctomycetota bacterium]
SLPRRITLNSAAVNDPPFLVGSDTLLTTTTEDQVGPGEGIVIDVAGPGTGGAGSMLLNFRAGPAAPAVGLPDENTSGQLEVVNVPDRTDRLGFLTPVIDSGAIVGYRYDPAPNFVGSDGFTYGVSDGDPDTITTGTVSIQVAAVNDAPDVSVDPTTIAVGEDSGLNVISDWLTTLTGPAGDASGFGRAVDEIDGLGAVPAQSIIDFQFQFVGGDEGLIDVTGGNAGFQINNGTDLEFTVMPDMNGTALYQIVVIDDGPSDGDNINASVPLQFAVSVGDVNDPPTFTPGASPVTVVEDVIDLANPSTDRSYDEPWATNISPGPADEVLAGQTVQFEVTIDPSDAAKFDVPPAIDGSTGNLSFVLAPDAEGDVIVNVTPRDFIGTAPGVAGAAFTLTIEIQPQDDTPRPVDDNFASDEDVLLRFTTADLLSNDSDPDVGDQIRVTPTPDVITSTLGATISINDLGEIVYDPNTSTTLQALIDFDEFDPNDPTQDLTDYQLVDTFVYTVTDLDGEVLLPSAEVTLTINGVNDAPTVFDKSIAINDTGLTRFNVFRGLDIEPTDPDDGNPNDFDIDGQIIASSFVITREPQFGDLSDDDEDGVLTYLPGPDFAGEDFFEYTVADNLGQDSESARFTFFGRPIPNGVVRGGTSVGREGEIDISGAFSSPFGLDFSTLEIIQDPQNGTATIDFVNERILYQPNDGFPMDGQPGEDFLIFRIADTNGNFSDNTRLELNTVRSRLQNPIDPADVNRSGEVTALDALLVINRLNASTDSQIPVNDSDFGIGTNDGVNEQFFYDVSGNELISALDALRVINRLNELEALRASSPEPLIDTSIDSLAPITSQESVSVEAPVVKKVGDVAPWDQTLEVLAIEQSTPIDDESNPTNGLDTAITQLF